MDASRWVNLAYTTRLAYHAENKEFTKAIKKTWGNKAKASGTAGDAEAFLKRFGKGF